MKKMTKRFISLLIALIMLLTVSPLAMADYSGYTAAQLKTAIQNANELPPPTEREERAARGAYLPYTGYFEQTLSGAGIDGRKANFYIPAGTAIRPYVQVLALPSGTDTEEFLVESGWIDVADEYKMILMILLPGESGKWGTYAEEEPYLNNLIRGGSGRKWYSVYSTYYVAGYGDGGDIVHQWCAKEPVFIISQAYFDCKADAAVLSTLGEQFYEQNPTNKQASVTVDAATKEWTFELVPKKDIPVPTFFFGKDTPAAVIDYWKGVNECAAGAKAGAGPLGSDIYWQDKTGSDAIATAYSDVTSQVAVLKKAVDYTDPAVTAEVFEALAYYTRYTNTSAWSNALGVRVDHKVKGVEIVDFDHVETVITSDDGYADMDDDPKNDPAPVTVKRTYMVYINQNYKKNPNYYGARYATEGLPVLYALGGTDNNATQYFEASQYVELADAYGFHLVFPSQLSADDDGVTTVWRVNGEQFDGLDDLDFIQEVVKRVNADYGEKGTKGRYIDEDRMFLVGHSNGGRMTNFVSMMDPELFTAYAVLAGTIPVGKEEKFDATESKVPMYGIYGEYDSASIDAHRQHWLIRLGLDEADAVTTDPYDLPARYNNPVEYLIYPDSDKYPGDKFETRTWYDENGYPMFNETLAWGREHNNTVPDMRRMMVDWFSLWDRDADGQRIYLGEKGTPPADPAPADPAPVDPAPPAPAQTDTHTVVWGDTLWALSRKHGCTVEDIVALNSIIKDPDLILVGWQLKIPQK